MNLKTAILSILNSCGAYALPKSLLKTEAKTRLNGPVGDTDFTAALVFLEDKGLVSSSVDPLTEDTRYTITAIGKQAVQ